MIINYEYLSTKIDEFLSTKTGREQKYWCGKLLKAEQLKKFGIYFGKGNIHVDGTEKSITCTKKVCFGADTVDLCGINTSNRTYFGEKFNCVV